MLSSGNENPVANFKGSSALVGLWPSHSCLRCFPTSDLGFEPIAAPAQQDPQGASFQQICPLASNSSERAKWLFSKSRSCSQQSKCTALLASHFLPGNQKSRPADLGFACSRALPMTLHGSSLSTTLPNSCLVSSLTERGGNEPRFGHGAKLVTTRIRTADLSSCFHLPG